jgi:hypothetical protein
MLKSLIWWNLLEKREAFFYEKALKTDICAVRFAFTALFSFKNEIFSSMDRDFYINAITTVRLALLTFLAGKRRILGRKNGTPRAKRPRA